jgi:FAD binding domain
MGKSTGAGSLAVWVHKLQSVEFVEYSSAYYTGKAGKIGAGLQGYDLNVAAKEAGLVFLAGACASVGTVGGYTQGGGHSPLSNLYGLSADQVLEWEVVDGRGNLLVATPESHSGRYFQRYRLPEIAND